ncbi:MAG TPA: MBL fold metallo-hydrolase [Candidatus Thermoplasmatota archaeon]|nr:MBL fold metallo-hydrolase [Candidatus Thermoplasmatota archaeon]
MADLRRRHPLDQGGEWFVDTTCTACDVAREVAPGLIAEDARGLSYFTRPPRTQEENLMAWRALLACPSASIGAPRGEKPPPEAYPWEVAPGAWYLGYNAASSYGANAYFVPRPEGNLMIDAPRWVPRVAEAMAERGGLAHILLTHQDDVADYEAYAAHFGARVWIHEADRRAAPYATDVFSGPVEIQRGVRALPLPGHTRGSAVFLVDDTLLFTGDSLEWSRETQDLNAFEDFTWYSWEEQADSLERLAHKATFEYVLPGHGNRGHAPPEEMRRRLLALVARMRGGRSPP